MFGWPTHAAALIAACGACVAAAGAAAANGALPRDATADARLLAIAGGSYELIETPHFVIARKAGGAGFSERVEQTCARVVRFARALGVEVRPPRSKLSVLVFATPEEYVAYAAGVGFAASEHVPGFYDRERRVSAFFDFATSEALNRRRELLRRKSAASESSSPTDATGQRQQRAAQIEAGLSAGALADIEEVLNRTVVQHEIAHHVLDATGVLPAGAATPAWLSEGLATLFETEPSARPDGVIPVNEFRHRDALAALRAATWIETRRLVSECEWFAPRGESSAAAYAQAWGLAYWLYREQPRALGAFIRQVGARPVGEPLNAGDELRAFEAAFGKIDADFDERWQRFLRRLPRTVRPEDRRRRENSGHGSTDH